MKIQSKIARLLIFFIFFSVSLISFGQSYHLNVSEAHGPLLKIYPGFPNSTGVYNTSLGIAIQHSNSTWRKFYKNPITGFYISFADFGNKNELGQGLGFQYYYRKEQQLASKLSFYETTLTGLMLYNKPYNAISNPTNIAIGSRSTFLVGLEVGVKYDLNKNISLEAGGRMIHGSNSHTDLPNVGINIPTYLVGFSYHWQKEESEKKEDHKLQLDSIIKRSWKIRPEIGLGFNENGGSVTASDGPLYKIYIIGIGSSKRTRKYGKFITLLQAYYNTGYRTYLSSQEDITLKNSFSNSSVLLLSGGYEFLMGRFGFNIMAGVNLHNPYYKYRLSEGGLSKADHIKSKLAGKFGLNYYLIDPYKPHKTQYFIGFNVKSNEVQADFFETKIGIEF